MHFDGSIICFSACLQGGRVTIASESTLAEEQKIARVYKQTFTGRVTLEPRTTYTVEGSGTPYLECFKGKKLTHLRG